MNPERHPELLDRLSADYLTGGMSARARRRFEALLDERPSMAEALRRWRERLDAGLLPQVVPESVWTGVQQRLDGSPRASAPAAPRSWGLRTWRALALGLGAAAATSLALLVALVLQAPAARTQRQLVAVLEGPAGHAAVLQVRGTQAALTAVGAQVAPPGKSFELWVLPRQGKPIAAGVVSLRGTEHMPMPPALVEAALQAKGFAISVEPRGGSPTGQPTGPVTYVGDQLASATSSEAKG